jgi:hypothetical protein
MRNYFCLWLSLLCAASFCAEKPNVVRADIDKYTQVNKFFLSTRHRLEGPGDAITNYSKGSRELRVDYFRKMKEDRLLRDEMRLEAQLFTDDAQPENRMIMLINDNPVHINDLTWTLERKTEPGQYLLASTVFVPTAEMKRNMRSADAMGIRLYLGKEPATTTYDPMALQAVHKFYAQETDEIWRH